MESMGYIQVRVYTSTAQIPLRNVAIVITSTDNTALAMRLTDRSGLIDPIVITVPDREESQTPNHENDPYTLVNLIAELPGYESILADNIQVFAGITTYQELEMIPLSDIPEKSEDQIHYVTPPQDL